MKKILAMAVGCLLLVMASVPALANEYGLRGGIYDIVSDNRRYDGYVSSADDGNDKVGGRHVNHAILQNRYHAVLIAAYRDNKVWQAETVSTTAVYQPGDKRGDALNPPELFHEAGGFILRYGEEEQYTFANVEGQYLLQEVRYGLNECYGDSFVPQSDDSFVPQSDNAGAGLLFFGAGPANTFLPIGDALWHTDGITLDEFNITQMPRSIAEVERLNRVSAALTLNGETLTVTDTWQGGQPGRKLPVYAAPDASSYRAAEGKASVSMGGEVEILGCQGGWTLIQYEVSFRTHRIGWIEGAFSETNLRFADVPLVTAADTFLTDDPFVSQYAQAYLAAGTALTGLIRCGEYYAYVECVQGETLYRGFVPMKDLDTRYDRALDSGDQYPMSAVRWDVMATLVGKWTPEEGSNAAPMILFSDGWKRNGLPGSAQSSEGCVFRVYGEGEEDTYDLVFHYDDGTENRYQLTLDEDGSILVSDGEEVTRFTRIEYSTYGNG